MPMHNDTGHNGKTTFPNLSSLVETLSSLAGTKSHHQDFVI